MINDKEESEEDAFVLFFWHFKLNLQIIYPDIVVLPRSNLLKLARYSVADDYLETFEY